MERFTDQRTEAVYATGFVHGVPKHVAHRGQWVITLLLAARDWQDVRVISAIGRWPRHPGRYGLHIAGKWYVSFHWSPALGAYDLTLERQGQE